MSKSDIFTIGIDIPGSEFSYIPFHSNKSLLDADIIIFSPTLDYETDLFNNQYQGLPNLSDESSVQNRNSIKRWRKELLEAFNAGSTVIILLSPPIEVFAATGEMSYSGTGKSRTPIRHVGKINSYDCLPITFDDYTISSGKKVRFTEDGSFLRPLWDSLSDLITYEVYFSFSQGRDLILTQVGDKTICKRIQGKAGQFILFPSLDFDNEEFTEYDEEEDQLLWSDSALKYGKILLTHIINLHKMNQSETFLEPAPEWVNSSNYVLSKEKGILTDLTIIEKELGDLNDKKRKLDVLLKDSQAAKVLLYGKGKPLEYAVINALKCFGFDAENYDDGDSEFDIVFSYDGNRMIGEVEGKDKSAINIKKLQQLERNIQEDYAKDDTENFAKGVMFGNPERLIPPEKRKQNFTIKAKQSAKRTGYALVNTPDMFNLVQYLEENTDESFKSMIRKAIFETEGDIVRFPEPPKEKDLVP